MESLSDRWNARIFESLTSDSDPGCIWYCAKNRKISILLFYSITGGPCDWSCCTVPDTGPVLVAEMLNVELSYVIILGIITGILQ